jgi:hypothetical protein
VRQILIAVICLPRFEEAIMSNELSEESVGLSFTLEDSEEMPPQETCPAYIKCMPPELVARVLDYALGPPILGSGPALERTNKWLMDNVQDWSSRQIVTIRARDWPHKPPRRFPDSKLPVKWLQTVQKVRFDFDGVTCSDRRTVHPVMAQLADIWKTTNKLRSLVLPIAPLMECLIQAEPRIELDLGQKKAFAPLFEIKGIEPEYIVDFNAFCYECEGSFCR